MRIATYNVHKCRGLDGRMLPSRIAGVLDEITADVLALQEVWAHQAEFLAAQSSAHYVMGANRQHGGAAYGNAILSRFPIPVMRNHDLSVPGREQRGCLRADVLAPGGRVLHIFNVHLGTGHVERRHQARLLITPQLLNDLAMKGPRVVLGDFNEWTRGLVTRLLTDHLLSADIRAHLRYARTYPGLWPFLHLDHIYYDPHLRLERLSLHRTRKALIASDHLPLVAEFGWSGSSHPCP